MQDYARYIPHTDSDVREMLQAIGVKELEDLFQAIPKPYRLKEFLKLPQPLSEPDLLRHLQSLQSPVFSDKPWTLFLV